MLNAQKVQMTSLHYLIEFSRLLIEAFHVSNAQKSLFLILSPPLAPFGM
jgi:hypothetical protein